MHPLDVILLPGRRRGSEVVEEVAETTARYLGMLIALEASERMR